ncbi:WW domain binding protein VOPP1-like isoform X2 [Osmerus eperlanus]|uniref:WW domain binding protein VOPP1-like isoform X2 n=1 Tax=Osmerus eperlanus TaxID=29151 RepID=UPI002E162668
MDFMSGVILLLWLVDECSANKKYCWYFEGGYPIYFMLVLMLGVVFCCGAGVFLRRRMYPSPIPDEPNSFNVHFTRQPITTSGLQRNVLQNYGDPGGGVMLSPAYPLQPHPSHATASYPPPPAYCSLPPPPYEQVQQETQKK